MLQTGSWMIVNRASLRLRFVFNELISESYFPVPGYWLTALHPIFAVSFWTDLSIHWLAVWCIFLTSDIIVSVSGLDRVIKTLCCSRQGRREVPKAVKLPKILPRVPTPLYRSPVLCRLSDSVLPSSSGDHNQPLVTPRGNCYNHSPQDWDITGEETWIYWLDNTPIQWSMDVINPRFHYRPRFVMRCNAGHVFVCCILPCLSVRPVFAGKSKQIIQGPVLP